MIAQTASTTPQPAAAQPAAIHFAPADTAAVITLLSDPSLSLRDVAGRHGTTVEALCVWLARPEIQEHMAAVQELAAARVRLIAAQHIPAAIKALALVADVYSELRSAGALPTDFDQRHRVTETSRKACNTIVRLTHFRPIRHTSHQRPDPHPSGRAVLRASEPADRGDYFRSESTSPPYPLGRGRGKGERGTPPPATPNTSRPEHSSPNAPSLSLVDSLPFTLPDESLNNPVPGPRPHSTTFGPSPCLSPANLADLITRILSSADMHHNRVAALAAFLDANATFNHKPLLRGNPLALSSSLAEITAAPLAPSKDQPPPLITGNTAHITRRFTTPRGQASLQLKLARRHNSEHPNSWLISSIRFRPPD